VAASSFTVAVLGTASLRGIAVIEPEGMETLRSGCLEEGTKPMHQACIGSAEREAASARQPESFGSASSRGIKVEALPLCAAASVNEEEFGGQAPRRLLQPVAGKALEQSLCLSSSAGSRLALPWKALPNPSIKPSPNSKAPGPRYSAGLLLLQRGPGALPSVPAYVER
jgi:hypothetical protein